MSKERYQIDPDVLHDLTSQGHTQKEIAHYMGISVPTLRKNIRELKLHQGLLLEYREVQSLQLTSLQAKVLEAITEDKIQEASLGELLAAYKILKEKEHMVEGKPTEVKGLVGYLMHIEKEEQQVEEAQVVDATVEDEDLSKYEEGVDLDIEPMKADPAVIDPENPNWMG
jgi:hypothetical protein